jgi:hypothetical protein
MSLIDWNFKAESGGKQSQCPRTGKLNARSLKWKIGQNLANPKSGSEASFQRLVIIRTGVRELMANLPARGDVLIDEYNGLKRETENARDRNAKHL